MKLLFTILFIIGSVICFSQVNINLATGVMTWPSTDTLEIPKHIRFIKIDGEVYEIKRSTSIEKFVPVNEWKQLWQYPNIQLDTTWNYHYQNPIYLPQNK